MRVVGLFAGCGGLDLGFRREGWHHVLLCEVRASARAVLSSRFADVPLAGDVRGLRALPEVDVVTAGFPCTDLSQAGRKRGIGGPASGLVGEVFRLVRASRRRPALVLENVENLLHLGRGEALARLLSELEDLGYRWAWRVVDSRAVGVPQRRRRFVLVAAVDPDPAGVLLADEADEPDPATFRGDCFGFYWTEGLRGVGWVVDGVPPLKGGSGVGIPSPPAVWVPGAPSGRRFVVPGVEDAERLQDLPVGWTAPAGSRERWRLVGDAVTVGVASWVARRLASPGSPSRAPARRRCLAAWGGRGRVVPVGLSAWPLRLAYRHLSDVVDLERASALSARAASGFLARARRSRLRFAEGFLADVEEHVSCVG